MYHVIRFLIPSIYSKTGHNFIHLQQNLCKTVTLKKTKNGFQDQLSLNVGLKYCRMLQEEQSAIGLAFIKLPLVIKIFVLSIFEWPFYTGFTVKGICRYMYFITALVSPFSPFKYTCKCYPSIPFIICLFLTWIWIQHGGYCVIFQNVATVRSNELLARLEIDDLDVILREKAWLVWTL